jgi:hypothetical protein
VGSIPPGTFFFLFGLKSLLVQEPKEVALTRTDTMAEWLRRQTRNLLGFPRVSSNLTGVVDFWTSFLSTKQVPAGDRTQNLLLRRQAPYPFGLEVEKTIRLAMISKYRQPGLNQRPSRCKRDVITTTLCRRTRFMLPCWGPAAAKKRSGMIGRQCRN